ncbi:MAG TPA: FRG domain-containing protein [Candidatus Acidoferrum sp.]|jgi:hypothetical protein|nr:FRG domain-containing protein [Candidatus Acidoferrum sp.]
MDGIMYGQWIGTSVNAKGIETVVTFNIEKRTPTIGQSLGHIPSVPHLRTCSTFKIPEFQNDVVIEGVDARFFDVKAGVLIPVEEYLKNNNLKIPVPKKTDFKFLKKGKILEGSFKNDIDSGTFLLKKTIGDAPHKTDYALNWKEFKDFVAEKYINSPSIIFRGQPDNSYKLRTAFHRCDRNNLLAYVNNDVPVLRHAVNAVSSFYYRENDIEQFGALLSLAQHHGYPTPILDWTFSPYIAAFFAFTTPPSGTEKAEAIRIFCFNMDGWPAETTAKIMYDPMPSISFHRFSAHNNPRFAPQQSIGSFSNVDDMENFIYEREKVMKKKFLTKIDIPITEKRKVLEELNLMGINAGSLFPGIDGVCRSLKERYFPCG